MSRWHKSKLKESVLTGTEEILEPLVIVFDKFWMRSCAWSQQTAEKYVYQENSIGKDNHQKANSWKGRWPKGTQIMMGISCIAKYTWDVYSKCRKWT